MTPDQFQVFLEDNRRSTADVIRVIVNGKIDDAREELRLRSLEVKEDLDKYNLKHDNDMARIMPVLEAYETSQRVLTDAKISGKVILYISGFVTALGSAYLITRQIFMK